MLCGIQFGERTRPPRATANDAGMARRGTLTKNR